MMTRNSNLGCGSGIIFLAIGLGIMIWGTKVLSNARASADWPATPGVITASSVERSQSSSSSSSSSSRPTYSANISYSYSVEGSNYTSGTVSFGQYGSSDSDHAREIVSRYPVNKEVDVFYNPEKPETSVLEPGVTWSSYLILGMGAIFAFAGLTSFFKFPSFRK